MLDVSHIDAERAAKLRGKLQAALAMLDMKMQGAPVAGAEKA
jgi:hypothetical protein